MKYDKNKAFDYENGFMLTSEIYRMGNFLAHYELYKKILSVPGDVVELGVFKGNSLVQFASFRHLLENERARKIIGFDVFGRFPENAGGGADFAFVSRWNENFQNEFMSREEILSYLAAKEIGNVELIGGDILTTLAEYVGSRPEMRIALLHIDTDVYEPAQKGLEILFDLVVPGGVIVFDDYGTVAGETKAVDEFLAVHPYRLERFTFSHTKPAYLIK